MAYTFETIVTSGIMAINAGVCVYAVFVWLLFGHEIVVELTVAVSLKR